MKKIEPDRKVSAGTEPERFGPVRRGRSRRIEAKFVDETDDESGFYQPGGGRRGFSERLLAAMRKHTAAAMLGLVLVGGPAATAQETKPAAAQPAAPAADAALDRSLLDQLTEGLDVPPETPAAKPVPPATTAPAGTAPRAETTAPGEPVAGQPPAATRPAPATPTEPKLPGIDGDLLKELTAASQGEAADGADPIAKIAERMQAVQDRLAKADAGSETQSLQTEIVAELDRLLKMKREQNKQASGARQKMSSKSQGQKPKPQQGQAGNEQTNGQSKPSGQPGKEGESNTKKPKDSDERTDAVTAQAPDAPLDPLTEFMQAEWGHLPEKDRNIVMQAFREKLLPQYDRLIRAYFEELARRGSRDE